MSTEGYFFKVGHSKHVNILIEIPSWPGRNCLCSRGSKIIPGTKVLERQETIEFVWRELEFVSALS